MGRDARSVMYRPRYRMRGTLSLGLSSESGGAKLGRAMSGTAIDYRVVIKRDPPNTGAAFNRVPARVQVSF